MKTIAHGFATTDAERGRWPVLLAVLIAGLWSSMLAGSIARAAPAPDPPRPESQRPAAGEVPALVHFQGRLSDAAGEPLADGEHALVFRLYPRGDGGSALWTESKTLSLTRGAFATLLGDREDITPSLLSRGDLWLGVQVDGAEELGPRYRLTSAAFALRSADADRLGGVAAEAYSLALHDHDARYVNVDGDRMAAESPRAAVLEVVNASSGQALAGHSEADIGVFGSSGTGGGLLGISGLSGVYGSGEVTGVSGAGRVTGVSGLATGGSGSASGVLGRGTIGVWGESESGTGVHGDGAQYGVYGESEDGMAVFGHVQGSAPAVFGRSDATGGFGVEGQAVLGTGVRGRGEMGVVGEGSVGPGLRGTGVVGVWGQTSIGAGVHGETDAENMAGVEGYSERGNGVYGNGANGVKGESSLGLGGTGVWGKSDHGTGVFGEGQRAGVQGEGVQWGVYAKSAEGIGLMAESRDGVAIYADGEVAQPLATDGLVKAAVAAWCDQSSARITRSFSAVHGAAGAVAPITIIRGKQDGDCSIDFGFDVSNRFVQVSAVSTGPGRDALGVTIRDPGVSTEVLGFFRWDADGKGQAGPIYVLVY